MQQRSRMKTAGAMLCLLLLLGMAAWLIRRVHAWPEWTGFGPFMYSAPPNVTYQRARTLWDWLQLLIVPAALALIVWQLNRSQKSREIAIAATEAERQRTATLDQQRQSTYHAYLDRMSELMLDRGLLVGSEPQSDVRTVARARTMAALEGLDGARKGQAVRFLLESGLIARDRIVVSLDSANLHGVQLAWSHLNNICLRGALLDGAHMMWVHCCGADLSDASLVEARMQGARLEGADLQKANLARADLRQARLSNTNLSQAHLEGAVLSGVDLSTSILKGAWWDETTSWPEDFGPEQLLQMGAVRALSARATGQPSEKGSCAAAWRSWIKTGRLR